MAHRFKHINIKLFLLCFAVFALSIIVFTISMTSSLSHGNGVNTEDSILVSALSSFFGDWEIVKDFGYLGIHRLEEKEMFEISKILHFNQESIIYEDRISIAYPSISIEFVTPQYMEQFERMSSPGVLGFDVVNIGRLYAKIIVRNRGDNILEFYVLNDDEIIIEGDVHRYYKAVRK